MVSSEGVSEEEGQPLALAEIGEPATGEETLAAIDEIAFAKGRKGYRDLHLSRRIDSLGRASALGAFSRRTSPSVVADVGLADRCPGEAVRRG